MNAALGLEHIANPAFIAGIAMVPFEIDAAGPRITDAPVPESVLAKHQPGSPSGIFFSSTIEYTATSLSTERSLSELLVRENLAAALAMQATAAGWPVPQVAEMIVDPPPSEPLPSEPEGIGVGGV